MPSQGKKGRKGKSATRKPKRKTSAKLTTLQKRFCREYVADPRDAAGALDRAGSKGTPQARAVTASRWLKEAKIKKEIARLEAAADQTSGKRGAIFDPSLPLKKPKWEAFVLAVFNQHEQQNYGEAYLAAGYKPGTRDAASKMGSALMKKHEVSERLKWLQQQAADESVDTARERSQRLTRIGRQNLLKYLREDGTMDVAGMKADGVVLTQIDVQELRVKGVEGAQCMQLKFKTPDPLRAAEIRNKMDGSNAPEEVIHKGEITNMPPTPRSIAEWEEQAAEARKKHEERQRKEGRS